MSRHHEVEEAEKINMGLALQLQDHWLTNKEWAVDRINEERQDLAQSTDNVSSIYNV